MKTHLCKPSNVDLNCNLNPSTRLKAVISSTQCLISNNVRVFNLEERKIFYSYDVYGYSLACVTT